MFNGVDLLIVVVALILIGIIWSKVNQYRNWYNWDQDRRYERRRWRQELQDCMDEAAYRIDLQQDLRLIFSSALIPTMKRVNRAFVELNKVFQGTAEKITVS